MKQKIMHALNEEQKKKLVDAETMWSQQKSQNLEKLEKNRIEEKSQRKSQFLEKLEHKRIEEKSSQEE